MIGVSEKVEKLYGEQALLRLLSPRSTASGKYEREPGTGTVVGPIPCAKHLYWTERGFVLVEIVTEGGMLAESAVTQ